jgi:hypothetical protein
MTLSLAWAVIDVLIRWLTIRWIGADMEGNGHGVVSDTISQYLLGETYVLAHSIQYSPWEADQSLQPIKKFRAFLWNPKVLYRTHKCLPPIPILSQLHLILLDLTTRTILGAWRDYWGIPRFIQSVDLTNSGFLDYERNMLIARPRFEGWCMSERETWP